jgi:hypothetical protein
MPLVESRRSADSVRKKKSPVEGFAQDQRLVESQHREELPLDLRAEFHIRANQMSTAYRKALVKLGLGREYVS